MVFLRGGEAVAVSTLLRVMIVLLLIRVANMSVLIRVGRVRKEREGKTGGSLVIFI